jgi:hypothetical protein
MNLQNAHLFCLMPHDQPLEWGCADDILRKADSHAIAPSVFLVRTKDFKGLAGDVELRLSGQGTYFACPLGTLPSSLSAKSPGSDTFLNWLHKKPA